MVNILFFISLCLVFQISLYKWDYFSQFSWSVVCNSLWPHGLQHTQASLSFTVSWSLLKLMSIKMEIPSNHFIVSQFLVRLTRSLRVPMKRRVWNSQGGRKDKLFLPLYTPQDYTTTMYPAWGQSLKKKKTFWLILLSQIVNHGSRSPEVFTTSRHSFDSL